MIEYSHIEYIELFIRVLTATLLGGLIGWERERHRNIVTAGIRTYGAIALGSCAFTVIGLTLVGGDPSRIASQVVTGIGFLGGGIIFRQGDYVSGLTTAATIWATASVGIAIAFGLYLFGGMLALLIFLLLSLSRITWWRRISAKTK